ncbi:MAG: thiamine phosphate synthase [Pirellulaceae bacterium]|nr:thiamine phosphate synthase [Pirellulaceae bacterium]
MDSSSVLRILDVNFNRAAEGLRTVEDVARVVFEDACSAAWLKSLRHELAELAARVPRGERLATRCVEADVGTQLTHAAELKRGQWRDVVVAANERTTQSLRVVEESAKGLYPELSLAAKSLRYRAYDRLAQVELRMDQPSRKFPGQPLYVLVDCQLQLDDFVQRLVQLVEAGADLFQIRDKSAEGATVLQYACAAVKAVGAQRVIVNDRVDIALASGAAGVHVGQEDLPIQQVQRLARGSLWIGVSTHNLQQAQQAQAAGADYLGCGPTCPSSTKRFAELAGLGFLRQVVEEIHVPVYAIGGINAANIEEVLATGVSRIAVSGAIWQANDPLVAAGLLSSRLRPAIAQRCKLGN